MERQQRRRKQLPDDIQGQRGYRTLKEETLDRTVWATRFGIGYGPVVREVQKRTSVTYVASTSQHVAVTQNYLHYSCYLIFRNKSRLRHYVLSHTVRPLLHHLRDKLPPVEFLHKNSASSLRYRCFVLWLSQSKLRINQIIRYMHISSKHNYIIQWLSSIHTNS